MWKASTYSCQIYVHVHMFSCATSAEHVATKIAGLDVEGHRGGKSRALRGGRGRGGPRQLPQPLRVPQDQGQQVRGRESFQEGPREGNGQEEGKEVSSEHRYAVLARFLFVQHK